MVSPTCAQILNNTKQADYEFLSQSKHWQELDVEVNSWWINQDSDGYIWFNSAEGLCRFDGNQFNYFKHDLTLTNSIPNGFITAMAFKNSKQAWIGFRKLGLFLFDLNTEKVLKSYKSSFNDNNGISSSAISSLLMDKSSRLWVITEDNTLQLFDSKTQHFIKFVIPIPNSHKNEEHDSSPGRIIQDVSDENILWIGSKFGLYQFSIREKSFQLYEVDHFVRPYKYQFATPIYQSKDGLIWYGHFRNEGVKVFDPREKRWIAHMPIDDKESTFTYDIKPYGDSLLIASIRPDHFLILDKHNPGEYSIIKGNHEIAKFSSLCVDKNLSLYSTSPTGKLTKLNRFWSKFEINKLKKQNGKSIYPWCILPIEKEEQYYISSESGSAISVYSKSLKFIREIKINTKKKLKPIRVNDLKFYKENNIIFIATDHGFYRYDRRSNTSYNELQNSPYEEIDFDEIKIIENTIFLISRNLILIKNLTNQNITEIKLPVINQEESEISDITFLDKNQLFISTTKGLFLYHLKTQTFKEYISQDPNIDPKSIINCNTLIKNGQNIWMGTRHNGIYKITQVDSFLFDIKNYFHSLSALANSFQSIKLINNQIWGSTSSGFTVFDIEKKDFISYFKTDGILRGYRKMKFYNGLSESIIVPYHDGIYQFEPSKINTEIVKPFLNKIQANNEDLDLNAIKNKDVQYIFNHKQRNIFFELGAQNFGVENKNFYRYRLSGFDNDWNYMGERNSINFVNLPVGKYTLEYDARSYHSFWNEITTKFEFEIKSHPLLTPFFKFLWFILVALGLVLLYGIIRNNHNKKDRLLELQKQRAISELKALKAQMNPHFLFNTLNSINWYIIKERSVEASKYLTKFAKLMRYILDNSKVEKISLAKELETLKLYTELEEVRFEGVFEYEFIIEKSINPEQHLMPPLIFQPFIENAIWHGLTHKEGSGKISLTISEDVNDLRCIIEDDGIGREAAQNIKAKASSYRGSSGIEITKKRIEGAYKNTRNPFKIVDLKDLNGSSNGTRIEILLPIEKLSSTSKNN